MDPVFALNKLIHFNLTLFKEHLLQSRLSLALCRNPEFNLEISGSGN